MIIMGDDSITVEPCQDDGYMKALKLSKEVSPKANVKAKPSLFVSYIASLNDQELESHILQLRNKLSSTISNSSSHSHTPVRTALPQ